ncbi:MAG: SdrD B-like domain-containing protein [Candidatus Kapaibacterium sp.]
MKHKQALHSLWGLFCSLVIAAAIGVTGGASASAQAGGVCDLLRVSPKYSGQGCCWGFTFSNNQQNTAVTAVTASVITTGGVVTSASGPISPTTTPTSATWSFPNHLPTGSTGGFNVCFSSPTSPTTVVFNWISNGQIVCRDTVVLDCAAQPPKDSCSTDTLRLNTGWSHSTNSLLPIGAYTSFWKVVADPSPSTSEPRPSSVIAVYPGWAGPLANSQWISSYPSATNDTNGIYAFETCFCVKDGVKNPRIVLDLLADDRAKVYLNGILIGQTPLSYAFHNPATHIDVNIAKILTPGRNCLRVEVENTNSVAMGMDLAGYVTADGIGYDTPNCCDPTGTIMGMKFRDLNCNGKHDPGEPGLPNWTIHLSNGQNTTTDALGNYYFTNIPAGTYVVNEVQQSGWTQSAPSGSGTYTVTLNAGQVVSGLEFGNCKDQVQDGCFKLGESIVKCRYNAAGQLEFVWNFNVYNLAPWPATYLTFSSLTPGVSFTPPTVVLGSVPPNTWSPMQMVVMSGPGAVGGASVAIVIRMCDQSRQRCCQETLKVVLPDDCKPHDCCSGFMKLVKASPSAASSGYTTLTGAMAAAGAGSSPIIRVEATLAEVTINSQPAYGYIYNGTISNPFGTSPGVATPFGHEVIWPTIPGGIAMGSPVGFNLKMQFPAMQWPRFRDTLHFCVRYRFTDKNCVTCDTLICYTRIRYRIIIWDGGTLSHGATKAERSLQGGPVAGISGSLHGSDSATMDIIFPTLPQELSGATYAGISIEPDGVGLTDVHSSNPGYTFYVANGMAYSNFSAQPGEHLSLGLTYDDLAGRKSVSNHVVFLIANGEDTLVEDANVILRKDGLVGGDKLTAVQGAAVSGVRTFALHLSNANGSGEPVSRLVIGTSGGSRILAVGPTSNDSVVALGFGAGAVGEMALEGTNLNAGASQNPIYVTLSGADAGATTVHFATLDVDGRTISEGDLILSTPLAAVRDEDGGTATAGAMLQQSYPNPARHSATIEFSLPAGENVTLVVVDAAGREVARLIDGEGLSSGQHAVFMETGGLASGTYYYTLRAGSRTETRSMQVVK